MEEAKPKGVSTGKIVSIVVIVALVAVTTFLIIQNLGLKSEVQESMDTAESLTAEIESVEKDMEELQFLLDEKELDVARKQELLDERDSLLQDKDARIASLLAKNKISTKEAERLRGRVEQLEFYVNKYQTQIDDLKRELTQKNVEIDSLKGALGSTSDSLNKTRDINTIQSIKLKAAAKLTAHTFTFYRLKQSGSPVAETSFRSSQLDKFRICIDIAANNVAKDGERIVYFQVKDAAGNVVKDDAKSGFFEYEDEHLRYSCMTKMTYTKSAANVCADFMQPTGYKYAEGEYSVHAFCDGWEIGKSSFVVD